MRKKSGWWKSWRNTRTAHGNSRRHNDFRTVSLCCHQQDSKSLLCPGQDRRHGSFSDRMGWSASRWHLQRLLASHGRVKLSQGRRRSAGRILLRQDHQQLRWSSGKRRVNSFRLPSAPHSNQQKFNEQDSLFQQNHHKLSPQRKHYRNVPQACPRIRECRRMGYGAEIIFALPGAAGLLNDSDCRNPGCIHKSPPDGRFL